MTGELISEPVGSNNRRAINPMKDRKFWEEHMCDACAWVQTLEIKIQNLSKRILRVGGFRGPYRDFVVERRMRSRLEHLRVERLYWIGRVSFYDERVRALEQRTRYQRILRSPVIPWPSVKSVQSPMGRRSA